MSKYISYLLIHCVEICFILYGSDLITCAKNSNEDKITDLYM
jgi:hypothetical protein